MSSSPNALKRYGNLLRDKLGPELSQAIISLSNDTAALHSAVDTLGGFSQDQNNGLSIDSLGIRSATLRFRFEDPPDTQTVSAAGYRVPLLGEWMRLNNTSGGALTLTSLPTIAAGKNGQLLELLNVSANNIILQDNGTLAGSTLRLGANTRTLGTRDSIALRYSTDIGGWLERWFSNVL